MRVKYQIHREDWAVIFHVTASVGPGRSVFGGWTVPRAVYRYRRQKAAQIIRAERAEFMRQARERLGAAPVDFENLLQTGTIRTTQQSPGVPGKKASGANSGAVVRPKLLVSKFPEDGFQVSIRFPAWKPARV